MPTPTAADLRAKLARLRVRIYEIAPEVGTHPTRLGLALNGRIPMSPDLARRMDDAVRRQRCLCDAGAVDDRGGAAPAGTAAPGVRRGRRRGAAGTGATLRPQPAGHAAAGAGHRQILPLALRRAREALELRRAWLVVA